MHNNENCFIVYIKREIFVNIVFALTYIVDIRYIYINVFLIIILKNYEIDVKLNIKI